MRYLCSGENHFALGNLKDAFAEDRDKWIVYIETFRLEFM